MRIWFNQGYSLAAIARAMMAADPALEVCVSIGPNGVEHPGPTLTWREPALEAEAYCDWVRHMVQDHSIDVLVPHRRRQLLAGLDLPCRVELAASPEVLDLLDNKFAFAAALEGEQFHLPTQSAASSDELRAMLADFRAAQPGAIPCVKPQVGVNGHGFWKLTQGSPMSHLMNPDARNIREDLYLDALAAQEQTGTLSPVVLMEYLPGPEVSIDALAHHGEALRMLARTKLHSRQRIESAHPLLPLAARLIERFGLHGMINLQFRRANDGSWKLLEINARAAGGAVYAEPFGSRMIADWGGLLSGRLTPAEVDRRPLSLELEFGKSMQPVENSEQLKAVAA